MPERYTVDAVLDHIERERRRLRELVARCEADGAARRVTEEGWTAKDVLAHCIHWASQLAFGMGARLQPPAWVVAAGGERPPGDEWNRRVVEHYRDTPLGAILIDFDRITDAVVEQVRARTDDEMNGTGAIPWAPAGEPLWRSIGSETFEHWPQHSAAIERALQLSV